MIAEVCFFLIVVAVVAAALGLAWHRRRLRFRERSSLPEELKGAEIEFAERLFRPVPHEAAIPAVRED